MAAYICDTLNREGRTRHISDGGKYGAEERPGIGDGGTNHIAERLRDSQAGRTQQGNHR